MTKQKRFNRSRLFRYYPDEGPLRRELYKKHTAFFAAGAKANIRAILAANRIGKSEGIGAYEVAVHATGLYPEWWCGKRFDHAPVIWAVGKTGTKARDVNQKKLLGEITALGTGMIPGDKLIVDSKRMKPGTPNAVESIFVKHESGALSPIVFKSYAEERRSFEGEEIDFIWLDEEPPLDIYGECLIRIMSTSPGRESGHILATFTPLDGMSEVVMTFLPDGKFPAGDGRFEGSRFVIMATWDDAPHLSKKQKDALWLEIPPYQRDARTKGVPQLGSGAIYPIAEENVACDDFEIPMWYPRIYGLDVGWNWTAATWGAHDLSSDTVYIYSVYKRGKAEPVVHAAGIQARGIWIPGVIDPNAAGSSQFDGKKLLVEYRKLLNDIYPADNAVESGIFAMWNRLSTGKMKVFKSCRPWFEEFRLYRRDDRGRVVKSNDHLMDGTRYLNGKLSLACEMPDEDDFRPMMYASGAGRNAVTGY